MKISDLQLELLALDELEAEEAADVRAALENDPDLRVRYERIIESNEQVLRTFPEQEVNQEVQKRVHRGTEGAKREAARAVPQRRAVSEANVVCASQRRAVSEGPGPKVCASQRRAVSEANVDGWPGFAGPGPKVWAWAAVTASALVVAFFLFPPERMGTRTKGGARLIIHRVLEGNAEQLIENAVVRQGDRLQLSVVTDRPTFGLVLSVDGRGQVTLHYPQKGEGKIPVGEPFVLPSSYELDDAPAFERFFLITQDRPIDQEDILNRARTKDLEELPLNLGEDAQQSSFILRKHR